MSRVIGVRAVCSGGHVTERALAAAAEWEAVRHGGKGEAYCNVAGCGQALTFEDIDYDTITVGWPVPLRSAIERDGTYALGLRDGSAVTFRHVCVIAGSAEFVALQGVVCEAGPLARVTESEAKSDRILWVRVADIVWCR